MDEKIIGEIEKTANKKTIISLTKFKGRDLINFRDYFKTPEMKDWQPTKKGVMINVDKAAKLVSIFEKVEDELNGTSKTTSSS